MKRIPSKESLNGHKLVLKSFCTAYLMVSLLGCDAKVKELWDYPSKSGSRSSPGYWNGTIVFGTRSGDVNAVGTDGKLKWTFKTRKEVVSTPVGVGSSVFFGSTDNTFYSVDAAGRKLWAFPTGKPLKGDSLVVDRDLIFGSYDGHLYRVASDKPTLKWSFPAKGQAEAAAKAAALAAKTGPTLGEGKAPPAAAADGKPADTGTTPRDAFSYARPTLTSNNLIVTGNLDGYLYAVQADTGAFAWRISPDDIAGKFGITSTVVEAGKMLYFGANNGVVYAVGLEDQKVAWSFKTGDEVNSSPNILGDTLFVGSRDKKLYALDAKTGKKKWAYACAGPILSKPAIYKNLVLFGAGEGDRHVYALNVADGTVFWKAETDGAVEGDPVVVEDKLYILAGDHLYAYEIKKTPG